MIYNSRYIPHERVFDALGIKGSVSGDNLSTRCPLHSDSNPSFSININNGLWMCFSSCGGGTIDKLVEQILGMNNLQAHEWLLMLSESSVEQVFDLLKSKAKALDDKMVEILDEDRLVYGVLPSWFADRGFDIEDINRWSIRFDSSTGALVIPIGEGFVKRFPPGAYLRYKYSDGFSKKENLFGFAQLIGKKIASLIVVEGSLNAMWAVKWGYDSVAILGSYPSERQIQMIGSLSPGEVILCMDNDEAGYKATLRFVERSKSRLSLSYMHIPTGVNDIQELTKQQIDNIFRNRFPIITAMMRQIGPWEKAPLHPAEKRGRPQPPK